jgi:hypothetical protein
VQQAVERAARRDNCQAPPLSLVERPVQVEPGGESVDQALPGLAFGAVGDQDAVVSERDLDAFEGPAFPVGVQPQRDARSGAERRQQEFVGRRAAVFPTGVDRLVADQPVAAGDHFLRQPGAAADRDFAHAGRPSARIPRFHGTRLAPSGGLGADFARACQNVIPSGAKGLGVGVPRDPSLRSE